MKYRTHLFASPLFSFSLLAVLCGFLFLPRASAQNPPAVTAPDRFRATLGVDDGVLGRTGTVRFLVQMDGKEVFRSEVMRPGDKPVALDLPLNGAHALRLIVDDAGDGHGGDWGDWADARLVDSHTGNTLFLSDMEAVVEQEWIATRLDRNLVQAPLTLDGVVYARGLGADSGSSMLYPDVAQAWQNRQIALDSADSAGFTRWGPVVLRGAPGAGVRALLNGTDVTAELRQGRSLPFSPGTVLQLRADRLPAGLSLVGPQVVGSLTLQGHEGARFPLTDALPTRIEALTPQPPLPRLGEGERQRNSPFPIGRRSGIGVSAQADTWPQAQSEGIPSGAQKKDDPPVLLDGRPYYGAVSVGTPMTLTYWNLCAALEEAMNITGRLQAAQALAVGLPPNVKRADAVWRLHGTVGLDTGRKTRYGLVRFRLFADDHLVWQSRPATPATPPQSLDLPFPHPLTLRLEVVSAGDGVYNADGDLADLRLTDARGVTLAYLSDLRPFAQWQNWGRPQRDRSAERAPLTLGGKTYAHGLGLAANAVVIYRSLYQTVTARLSAEQKVVAARALRPADTGKARTLLEQAVTLCPELAAAYIARAELEAADGRSAPARAAWQRLVDIASAAPDERRRAQQEIARLEPGLADPLPLRAAPSLPAALREWTEGPPFLFGLRPAERAPSGMPPEVQQGYATFRVEEAEAGQWLTLVVNSRGLEVAAWLAAESAPQKPLAPVVQGRNPTLRWRTQPGRYRLVVTHDPGKDEFLPPFALAAVAALTPTPPEKPTERWRYRLQNDGSVLVTVTLDAPGIVLLPKTAETAAGKESADRFTLVTPDARALLSPSAFAYGSTLEGFYALSDGLLLAPGKGRKAATLTFLWRDGAYDVPQTRYAADHAHKHFFASLRGINPDSSVEVTVALPAEATKATRAAPMVAPLAPGGQNAATPDGSAPSGPVYRWTLPPDRVALLEAENPRLESRWISAKHRNMTLWLPDCVEYRRWLPDYLALLKRIYDRESALMGGYETQEERFICVTAPAQLSGYGGATWGDPKVSETWIACGGHVGAYSLLAQPGGDGVEAHELKWVHLGGTIPDLPRWLQNGTVIWLEEQGKLAGGAGFADQWTWAELAPKAAQYEALYAVGQPGAGFVWMAAAAFGKLPSEQKALTAAMDWCVCQTLLERYGETFWPRFWQKMRQQPDRFANLDEDTKTARVVDDIVTLTGDEKARDLFRHWGFRLK